MEPEDFERKIVDEKVSLSSCTFSSGVVVGSVIGMKMDGDSTITVRYTTNEWETYADVTGSFCGEENESQDRFTFEIDMKKKTRLHFAICLHTRENEFWDNNDRNNYSLILE